MRSKVMLVFAVVFVIAGTASAQTNVSVSGGALFPLGDFSESADVSPYVGGRIEFQDVNALGQVAVLSYLIEGGFAFLTTDSDLEAQLDSLGQFDDGYYFEIGGGARAYSSKNPLFVGVGVKYASFDPAGPQDAYSGVGGHVGIGFVITQRSVRLDVEARINIAFMEEVNDIEHFLVMANIGFPLE